MSGKVLEHAGFQGTAKSALDVLTGVTSEYLLNVGRTIKLLSDKFANKMTPEEIILHTLFESGTTKIQDLERYIKDDVVRYGSRLGDLEKKLVGAYREATAVEALDDDALFGNEEDEEEDGAFVMGNFADALGDDFLGLRELGIAAEFGMSSLSIPKKLLKGKSKGENKLSSAAAQPKEPPPPYPPPPPFVPLNPKNVNHQIGLLKPYYQERLSILSSTVPPVSALSAFPMSAIVPTHAYSNDRPPVMLQDDPPNPSQVKIGPLSQIVRGGPSGGASKKKTKGKDPAVPVGHIPVAVPMVQPTVSGGLNASELPQKKAGPAVGGAAGTGGAKKKGKVAEGLPPVVVASA
jgi:transcriptional activator SPT7